MFGPPIGLKVCHGCLFSLRVAGAPFGKETDGQTAELAEHPDGVAVANTTVIFIG